MEEVILDLNMLRKEVRLLLRLTERQERNFKRESKRENMKKGISGKKVKSRKIQYI